MARLPGVLQLVCVRTPALIQATLELSRPRLAKPVRDAYHAPYRSAERRAGIGAFVDDIPLDPSHPSAEALDRIVAGLVAMREIPALLLWGSSDPVFSDIYLRDLEARLPRADVHRFVGASHLVSEEADIAGAVHEWIAQMQSPGTDHRRQPAPRAPAWAGLDRRAGDTDLR